MGIGRERGGRERGGREGRREEGEKGSREAVIGYRRERKVVSYLAAFLHMMTGPS